MQRFLACLTAVDLTFALDCEHLMAIDMRLRLHIHRIALLGQVIGSLCIKRVLGDRLNDDLTCRKHSQDADRLRSSCLPSLLFLLLRFIGSWTVMVLSLLLLDHLAGCGSAYSFNLGNGRG